MQPITFTCSKLIHKSSTEICSEILDMARWEDFKGYAILPAIKKATFETKTENIIGSRIKVTNMDGSTHTEEIYKWIPTKEIAMKIFEFSAPLDKIATHFTEEWDFEPTTKGTIASRTFHLYPKSKLSYIPLWLISLFFKKAIRKHLNYMYVNSVVG